MGYLDKYTADKFRGQRDGRTVFYPKGPDGPGYLLPDERTRERLERVLKAIGVVGAALLFAAGRFSFLRDGRWWLLIPPLLFLPAAQWYVGRYASEHFPEVYQPYVFDAAEARQIGEDGYVKLWAVAIGAALGVAAGVVVFVRHPSPWARWSGLAIGILFGLFVPIALQNIQRKRELDRQKRERTDAWLMRPGSRRRFW
jgi:hypothetical protein